MPRQFQDVLADLDSDGSLRDFYILDASACHWNRFLAFVRTSVRENCFRIDDDVSPLPSAFEQIYALRPTAAPSLRIPVGEGFLVCHFFSDSEIELDFRPEDYRTAQKWATLCAFLQGLVDAVELPGIVTPENQETEVIERFEPRRRGEQHASPNSRPPSESRTSPEIPTPDSLRDPSSGGCG